MCFLSHSINVLVFVVEIQYFLPRRNEISKRYSRDVRCNANINHSVADRKSNECTNTSSAAKQQNLFIVMRIVP